MNNAKELSTLGKTINTLDSANNRTTILLNQMDAIMDSCFGPALRDATAVDGSEPPIPSSKLGDLQASVSLTSSNADRLERMLSRLRANID